MIGGGPGAFVGAVHRRAAGLDGDMELAAGAFSSDPERSAQQGRALYLDPGRVYGSYEEMAREEGKQQTEERLDFVVIVTPNDSHFQIASAFLELGFPVVCDKPLTTTVRDAVSLVKTVESREALFAVTYNYSGYPMIKQARDMVRGGELGALRKVVVEYSQGWLAQPIERDGQKQAAWRNDPHRGGSALALGDIGTHAEHLVRYTTGRSISSVMADLTSFVPGRTLEDDANVLFHGEEGLKGVLHVSQISVGKENHLAVRVIGERASLEWKQENPNYLDVFRDDAPAQRYTRGHSYLSESAQRATRLPPGHPEGFIEAFGNIYAEFARAISDKATETTARGAVYDYPTVHDGLAGVRFIHGALESHSTRAWVDITSGD